VSTPDKQKLRVSYFRNFDMIMILVYSRVLRRH
jgi:hypothetical protein